MIAFSPGLVQGCFELVNIVSRNALTMPQISSSFARLASVPSGMVIETAQSLNWVRDNESDIVTLTPWGERLMTLTGYERMLRQALVDYIEVVRPPWIQNALFGRTKVIAFAGSQIGQVIVEAGLVAGTDEPVVSFWDAVASMARGRRQSRLLVVGRQGERRTLAYEEGRTGRKPTWVAIDNNQDGYDVLSVVDSRDFRPLSIEVKTSTVGLTGVFYLSRNEWERAQESDNHCFHLWDISNGRQPKLAVVSPGDMQPNIPSDRGAGIWENVEIPFRTFETRFSIPTLNGYLQT